MKNEIDMDLSYMEHILCTACKYRVVWMETGKNESNSHNLEQIYHAQRTSQVVFTMDVVKYIME